jgi:hypothetical protein
MLGRDAAYDPVPYFFSDQHDVPLQQLAPIEGGRTA